MKHVFPSDEIPHLWMHQTQSDARSAGSGNLYFEQETIFSYGGHFPIARHVKNKSGRETAILFTTKRYSSTTSGHISMVRGAIPKTVQVFNVPYVYVNDAYAQNAHTDNLVSYVERINSALISCVRARSSYNKEYEHGMSVSLTVEVKLYCKFFGLKLPKLPTVPALDSDAMAVIKTRESVKLAKQKETAKLEAIEQAKRDTERIEKWRAGDSVGNLYNVPVMLRIAKETHEGVCTVLFDYIVETSRGARIPVSHALRGLKFVRAVVKSGVAYVRNGHTLHLGHYQIDRIDPDGTLTAGCHVISYAEIERIAPELEALKINTDEETE